MLNKRTASLQKKLTQEKIDALLVSSVSNIFYLTGISHFSNEEREAYLFITKNSAFLFTDMRYIEGIRKRLPKTIKLLDRIELFSTLKKSPAQTIGIENNFTVAELQVFKKQTKKKFKLSNSIVEDLRSQKEEKEIALLRSATRLTDMTLEHIIPYIKIGVSEKDVALEIETFIKLKCGALAFDTIVAFGPNAAYPHHKTSDKKLSKNDEFVLIDFGAKVGDYHADMTRTFLTKSPSRRAKLVYNTVYHAQGAAAKKIMEGERSFSKITAAANNIMSKNKYPSIPHGLGHGIGINIHEAPTLSPKSKGRLLDGMVFTIEPGIYIPGFGGVRIEDDYVFQNGELQQLTKSKKEIVEMSLALG